jgi:3-oxoacyl-[acyl-carrier-protein] synthase II
MVIGEGAGILVLESPERAKARNAGVHALITGYATTCDGYDRIRPNPDARQLARCLRMALESAAASADEIDYISLDGCALPEWDASELKAIREVFGSRAAEIPVSCPKSMFGNLLGASGAVDVIVTLLAMEHSLVPVTLNLDTPAENGIQYVRGKPRTHTIRKALIISRGRGGINSALVVENMHREFRGHPAI